MQNKAVKTVSTQDIELLEFVTSDKGIFIATSGLVLGLFFHAGVSYREAVKEKKSSPYRILSQFEENGVVFALNN